MVFLSLAVLGSAFSATTPRECLTQLRGIRDQALIYKMIDARLEFLANRPKMVVKESPSAKWDDDFGKTYHFGLSPDARVVSPGDRIFRRYSSRKALRVALEYGKVRNGAVPYIRRSPRVSTEIYTDLTGIFLTLPDRPAHETGVTPDNNNYVDMQLPPEVQLLELEAGRIYLIPLPRVYPKWIREPYQRYLTGQQTEFPAYYSQLIQQILEEGGLLNPVSLKVKIVGHGVNSPYLNYH